MGKLGTNSLGLEIPAVYAVNRERGIEPGCQVPAPGRKVSVERVEEWCMACIRGQRHDLCTGPKPPTHPCERVWGKCRYGDRCMYKDLPRMWCLRCIRGAPHTVCDAIKPDVFDRSSSSKADSPMTASACGTDDTHPTSVSSQSFSDIKGQEPLERDSSGYSTPEKEVLHPAALTEAEPYPTHFGPVAHEDSFAYAPPAGALEAPPPPTEEGYPPFGFGSQDLEPFQYFDGEPGSQFDHQRFYEYPPPKAAGGGVYCRGEWFPPGPEDCSTEFAVEEPVFPPKDFRRGLARPPPYDAYAQAGWRSQHELGCVEQEFGFEDQSRAALEQPVDYLWEGAPDPGPPGFPGSRRDFYPAEYPALYQRRPYPGEYPRPFPRGRPRGYSPEWERPAYPVPGAGEGHYTGRPQWAASAKEAPAEVPDIQHQVTNPFKNRGDESEKDVVAKKVQGILNRITPEKYDVLSQHLVGLLAPFMAEESEMATDVCKEVSSKIFEKAVGEPQNSVMYADLVQLLHTTQQQATREKRAEGRLSAATSIRTLILNRCQKQFYSVGERSEDAAEMQAMRDKHRKRCQGNARLVAEVYLRKLLPVLIFEEVIRFLTKEPSKVPFADRMEVLCTLLMVAGGQMDWARPAFVECWAHVQALSSSEEVVPRIRFLLQDLMELQASEWSPRRAVLESPKKLADVRRDLMLRGTGSGGHAHAWQGAAY